MPRETLNHSARARQPLALLALIILLGSTGCGGSVRDVVGEAPLADVAGLNRSADGIVLELALRNVNDQALELAALHIQLGLAEQPLVDVRMERSVTITARSREVLRLPLMVQATGLERLDKLATGEVQRLPWQLSLTLTPSQGRTLHTQARGWLHPVPGRADQFR